MDTPTRRFDEDDPDDGTPRWTRGEQTTRMPRRCLRCDYPLTAGMLHTAPGLGKLINTPAQPQSLTVSIWAGKNWLGVSQWNQAPCDVLVCTRCGYTEMAIDPARLAAGDE